MVFYSWTAHDRYANGDCAIFECIGWTRRMTELLPSAFDVTYGTSYEIIPMINAFTFTLNIQYVCLLMRISTEWKCEKSNKNYNETFADDICGCNVCLCVSQRVSKQVMRVNIILSFFSLSHYFIYSINCLLAAAADFNHMLLPLLHAFITIETLNLRLITFPTINLHYNGNLFQLIHNRFVFSFAEICGALIELHFEIDFRIKTNEN